MKTYLIRMIDFDGCIMDCVRRIGIAKYYLWRYRPYVCRVEVYDFTGRIYNPFSPCPDIKLIDSAQVKEN